MAGVHGPAMTMIAPSFTPFATIALVAAALSPVAVSAQSMVGHVYVVDGDTVEMAGQRIRLFGVDAPESTQNCERGGVAWACGAEAGERLTALIAARPLRCEGQSVDDYGRVVAICRVGSIDLGQSMVQTGWAMAYQHYSNDYVADEAGARAGRRGIWTSNFSPPSEWRAAQRPNAPAVRVARGISPAVRRTASAAPFSGGCVIKGNINQRGEHIYHLPGMPYYAVTRAEAMFCSEAQAQAAGFRRAILR